jgi:hypothetical protein
VVSAELVPDLMGDEINPEAIADGWVRPGCSARLGTAARHHVEAAADDPEAGNTTAAGGDHVANVVVRLANLCVDVGGIRPMSPGVSL